MKYLTLCATITAVMLGGCNNKAPSQRSAALTVTYNGQEVHRRNTGWISATRLASVIKEPTKKIFIFGASWCKPCNFLKRAIKQIPEEPKYEIHWINVDEEWAQKLMAVMGQRTIPYMISVDEDGNTMATREGPSKITMYLLLN